MTLATAGCFHFGVKPISANPPTQQQMEAYAQEQTALRSDASDPKEKEHCDQLATATPGVEELRTDRGTVESRQWTLVADGSAPHWAIVRALDSSLDGWAPKPGIDKLDFQPPLEPALAAHSDLFLAYAPVESSSLEDSQKAAAARQVFGAAQGNFTWRGRKYSYTLAPSLPCFPQPQ